MTLRDALAIAAVVLAPAAAAAQDISLSSPVACPAGMLCPVQNLFDHFEGPGARDFRCTSVTYDGHDGTDVRAPSIAAQRAGIEVRAAADGVVMGARDGMADVGIKAPGGREAVKNLECGNGLVLRHEGGWETQYCHMANGSLAVKKGDEVKRGQALGKIGLSGLTEFPHLHFALRKDGKKLDPYALDGPSDSCGPTRSAWAPDAEAAMKADAPLVLNAGFSAGPAPSDAIDEGTIPAPGRDPAALVVYGRAIGLATGDSVRVTLIGADGKELAKNETPPFDKPKAQWSAFAGRKRPAEGWPAGTYRGKVEIRRLGKALRSTDIEVAIGG